MRSVSIICTNHNKGDAVAEAIESFLVQQTSFPMEILLIDDASTDGSQEIIRYYCDNYPDRITGIFNETNEGIAKTWQAACKVALGDYIARCDADDYWVDPLKLQKQVDLLELRPDSQWSNTDFDLLTPTGEYIKGAIESGVVPSPANAEEALVMAATTMPSTWLVDAGLVREVNESVNASGWSGIYAMQLELFKRTNLATLPESTTVCRSDASSMVCCDDPAEKKERVGAMLEAQLAFIDSDAQLDFKELSKKLVQQRADRELKQLDA